VKRTLNNVITYYIYDGEKPILEYNSAGAMVGRNVYGKGIDEILMRTDLTQTYYFQQDHEGSVTHLTNASGVVIESYRYDAFGAPTTMSSSGTYNNRFRFTGREYAATFGFYEYRARAYNPTLGRFMSEDPKGFAAGDYNLFRYCHNNPEDLTDPMGLAGISSITYEQLTAKVQWEMRYSTAGAIGVGTVVHQAWTALSKAMGGLTMGRVAASGGRSLEGTNPGLGIPKEVYGTGSEAAKAGVDPAYDVAERTRDREMIGPVGQINGFNSGHLFSGPFDPGIGKILKGPYAGDQGSYIDRLTANLPKGSHLVGYYTVHPHFDPSRVQHIDAPIFERHWGIPAHILMKAPGYNDNWDKPMYYSYPPHW
jgi:RHS repeat-associated protein